MSSAAVLVDGPRLVAETPVGLREVRLEYAECCEAVSLETAKLQASMMKLNEWRDKLLARAVELQRIAEHAECWIPTCAHCSKLAVKP